MKDLEKTQRIELENTISELNLKVTALEEQVSELKHVNSELVQKVEDFKNEKAALEVDVLYYKTELAKFKRMLFGQKRERFIPQPDGQLQFDFMPAADNNSPIKQESISYTRTKTKPDQKQAVRLLLPAHLPRKEYIIQPQEQLAGAKKIGEIISEMLEYQPGVLFVKRTIRPKYVFAVTENRQASASNCGQSMFDSVKLTNPAANQSGSINDNMVQINESVAEKSILIPPLASFDEQPNNENFDAKNEKEEDIQPKIDMDEDLTFSQPSYPSIKSTDEVRIIVAPMPSSPLPKSNAGPGLLAHLLVSKYVDHLPFYRQRQMFKREGIDIAESTINGWFTGTCNLLSPLYEVHKKLIQSKDYLQADESPIPVLTQDKPGSTHKGYQWVYQSPVDKTVCFDYQTGRGREGPNLFLKNFQGTLQTDGYVAYDSFEKKSGITLLACMAHARRKFDEAKSNDPQRATRALTIIQQLYRIESDAKEAELDTQAIRTLRLEKAVPILEELHQWLKTEIYAVLPKSAIGKAIQYTLGLWDRLSRYVNDGRYQIDNNRIENSIRPLALGRKNYLFAGSHQAAQRAAMMYSFFGTCKLHQINPFEWLNDVLTRISDHKANRLAELLPQNWKSEKK